MWETSIEITRNDEVFFSVEPMIVWNFLLAIYLGTLNEEEVKFFQMREGMVNPNREEVIISLGLDVYDGKIKLRNILSSMSWDNMKEFIGIVLSRRHII